MSKQPAGSALCRYLNVENVAALSAIGVTPRQVVEGCLSGNHRSPFYGFAVEFAGHRQYVPGDDIRHLDWKAYYKSGRYLLKQYSTETNFIAHLLIDVSESMTFEYEHGRKIDYAAYMAVALAFIIQEQSDMVSATLFSDRIVDFIRRSNTEEVVRRISTAIEDAAPKDPTAFRTVLNQAAEQMGRRGIVMIFSDVFGDLEAFYDGLKRLLYSKHEVIVFHLLDPVETDFELAGEVIFDELEGRDKITIPAHRYVDAYREEVKEYLEELQRETQKMGVEYVRVPLNENFGVTLARYLNERTRTGTR